MKTYRTNEDKYTEAKKRVENLKGFYYNILAYILIIPCLIMLNLWKSPGFHWFWFPVIGWGIGICFQAVEVFKYELGFGKDWEERKIQEYMKEDEKQFYE